MSYYVTNENSVLNINNAHLKVSGNIQTDVMKLGAIEFAPPASDVPGTVNFTNVTTGVTTSSNLNVGGTLMLGSVELVTATAALEQTVNLGNVTSNTVQFTNAATSLVASGNVVVTGNVTADYFVGDGSNITGISSTLQAITDSGPGANVTSNTVQFSNAITGLVTTANVEVGGELTVSGNVAVDTDTLFVDSVNDRVGIGTVSPDTMLEVAGNAKISSVYRETFTVSSVATGTYVYLGRFSTQANAIVEIASDGNSQGNSNKFEFQRQYNATPHVSGIDSDHYLRHRFFFKSVNVLEYDLWHYRDGTSWSTPAGTMTYRIQSHIYSKPSDPGSSGSIECLYSLYITNEPGSVKVGIGTANPSRLFHVHQNLSTSGHQVMARIGGDTSSYSTLVFGSKEGRPHIGGHKGDFGAWHDLSLQDDKMVIQQGGSLILKQHSKPGGASETQGIRFTNSADTARWQLYLSNNNHFRFAYGGVLKGWVDQNDGNAQMNGNFTGQHRTFIKDVPFSRAGDLEGLIVSSDQNKYIKMTGGIEAGSKAITTNESLPVVSLSVSAKDKTCFGVISASEDSETRTEQYGVFGSTFEKEKGDTRVYVNSVGEGAIWVSNIGGNLEAGDYITTSDVAGYGQKQDDDILHNYTVAKITMDCDFDPVTQPVQVIKKDEDGENVLDEHNQIQWEDHPTETEKAYKIRYLDASGVETDEASAVHKAAFVGCTYHCG